MMSTLKKLGLIFVIMGGVFMMARASSAEELTVTKTVYLEHGASVDPKALVRTHDNGFIVVGGIEKKGQPKSAWATKTDSEGNAIWRYVLPPREEIHIYDGPEYSSAAVMPDDSVFLCGRMPFNADKGVSSPGLLTHLDKDGKLLNENMLYPPDRENVSITHLISCMQSGNGVVVVGWMTQFFKNTSTEKNQPPHIETNSYFVLSLDGNGQVKWKKLIPLSDKLEGYDFISPLQTTANGGFILVSARSLYGTRVIHINANGEVVASKMLTGTFVAALPMKEESDIQLVSKETENLTRVTLNSDLKEIDRITEAHEIGEADMVYRLPDQSLIIFSAKHNKDGTYYQARVMAVNSRLKDEKTVLLGERFESYHAQAGIPLDKVGELVSIRKAIKHSDLGIKATDEQLADIRTGVGLDFITLK
jgi:hypothetical protein